MHASPWLRDVLPFPPPLAVAVGGCGRRGGGSSHLVSLGALRVLAFAFVVLVVVLLHHVHAAVAGDGLRDDGGEGHGVGLSAHGLETIHRGA